ncbi:MAG: ATP-binding cassette domain-containing protein [Enterocloster sp.]
MEQHVELLSGGNRQKVLMGRWMINAPSILIVDEPTRGIDVNAKAEIHRLLGEMNKNGTAVILVSSEMPEVLGMSDRIVITLHRRPQGRRGDRKGRRHAELLMQIAFRGR